MKQRFVVAVLVALVLASGLVHAAVKPNVDYVPYCDGIWFYVNSTCWLGF